MSIIFAVRTNQGTVMVTDSQRVSPSGKSEAPYDKSVRLGEKILFAWCGLLEAHTKSIGDYVSEITDDYSNLEKLVNDSAEKISSVLSSLDENEVAFKHRRVDVLFASRGDIYTIGFFPDNDGKTIRTYIQHGTSYFVAGDESAKQCVINNLVNNSGWKTYRIKALKVFVQKIGVDAISDCSDHPNFPGVKSCSSPVRILAVPEF